MKVILIRRSFITKMLILLLLIGVSMIYTVGVDTGILSVFINNEKQLPIYCVETEEKRIAISFDAAWGADYTEELLRILEEHEVKTTFFLVAFWVDTYPDMVKKIAEKGHEIGNHSAKHPKMSQLSEEQIIKELKTTSDKIEALIGKPTVLFRPPFGDYNNRLIKTARDMGITTIQWDVDSLDYKDYGRDAIINRVCSKVTNGSIVLFHNNATYTKDALPIILDKLQAEGYKIVPISELIMSESYYIDHTGRQRKLDN